MTTNIHYLIAGMAVLLVVIWQYSRQRQMDDRNSRMFRRLLSVVSLDVAAELVSTGFILYAPYSFNVCRMLSNTVFYLFQALLPLLLLYYVCTLCTSRVIAPSAVLRMGIPTIALVCIILTNPFTEMLFYFDGTGYRHGPWYLLLYVSALLHIAGAAVFVAVHRASVSRRNLASLFAVFALAALGIAAQAVNPSVLTTGFGLSLSILAMYLTINNPCACMDSLTGLNDKQYLLRLMDSRSSAAEIMMTGISSIQRNWFMCSSTAKPSIFGILMSSSTRSMCISCWSIRSACAPSTASAYLYPSPRMALSISRFISESSTIRIFCRFIVVRPQPGRGPSLCPILSVFHYFIILPKQCRIKKNFQHQRPILLYSRAKSCILND